MNEITLQYIDVKFNIKFEKPFLFYTSPPIVFRSILGSRLKRLSCLAPNAKCSDCQFNKTCVYAIVFETIIEKDTAFLNGRDKGSHPFRFKMDNPIKLRMPITDFTIIIQLYGFAIQYLPYIYYALCEAGKNGLFKKKSVFHISEVSVHGVNLLKEDGNLRTNFTASTWNYVSSTFTEGKKIENNIKMVSPLRFRVQGKYTDNFSAQDFFECIQRRLVTICSLYGTYKRDKIYCAPDTVAIKNSKLVWLDYEYNSHRQNKKIKMGGVIGNFDLIGILNEYDIALLNFVHIFGAGKNTNFGLGDIIVN